MPEELTAETEATLTISFQRTISVKQYEPVQAFGALKFGLNTTREQVEALLGRFEEYAPLLATKVSDEAEAKATELRGSAPAPVASAPAARRAPAAARGGARKQNPIVMVEGIEFESYENRDGGAALKGQCQVCGQPSYFNPSVGSNGVAYSAEQNVKSALKFKKGIFCKDHRGGAAQVATAPRRVVAPVVEEDDDGDVF